MRGEDPPLWGRFLAASGSPPHARGRPPQQSAQPHNRADHPRMRGEDGRSRPRWVRTSGSPPHARGRLRRVARHCDVNGITPACAGKTRVRSPSSADRRDHPRMRGEDVDAVPIFAEHGGSPPHARGRPDLVRNLVYERGITPACAGKTLRVQTRDGKS